MDWVNRIAGFCSNAFDGAWTVFMEPSSFLSPWPLFVAFIFALGVVGVRRLKSGGQGGSLLGQVMPLSILRHPSTRIDLWIILINEGLLFFLPAVGSLFLADLRHLVMPHAAPGGQTFWTMAAFTLYYTLVWDFMATYAHYLKHKIPVLWEFHKVHHSAEVMTPLTALRRHPVEKIVSQLITGVGLTVAIAAWALVFGMPGSVFHIAGSVALIYVWRLLGYNIRHSHVWISYGGFWNHIFVSPAHHQIHHSCAPAHYDTNFGHILSVWDKLLGTYCDPATVDPGKLAFGIEPEEHARLQGLGDIYVEPMVAAFARFRMPRRTGKLAPHKAP